MGTTKISSDTNQQATPTAEETAMNKAQLEQFKQYEPGQTQMFQNAFAMGNQLLTSFGNTESDQWKSLIGGVTSEQQQRMITEQDRLLKPQFQQQGIYDSGMAATGRMRAATDLANQNAQFNVGALQNALNLALSGQAQVQSPALGQSNQLSTALQGLRSNQTGTGVRSPFQGVNLGILGQWGGGYTR
jgi:hypothetical protein